jgi:hypothetical protein
MSVIIIGPGMARSHPPVHSPADQSWHVGPVGRSRLSLPHDTFESPLASQNGVYRLQKMGKVLQ